MKKLLLSSILAFGIGANAQVGPPTSVTPNPKNGYGFTQSSGSYAPLSASKTVWQSGATLGTDAASAAVALPFTFKYNNKDYTSIFISNNGFVTFGNAPLANTYTGLSTNNSSPNIAAGAIAGFAVNLRNANTTSSEIAYETVGSKFIIQFTDLQGNAASEEQLINFQIHLDSSNNSVAIVYGTCVSGTASLTGQVGLKGANSYDANNRTGLDWTATTSAIGNTNFCTLGTTNSTTVPDSGLTFTFTPGTWIAAPSTYATLPFSEAFASWANGNSTADLPNATYWRTWPSRGNNSWRQSDIAIASTGYTSVSGWQSAGESPDTAIESPAVVPTARFHSFFSNAGYSGYMDLYVDLSAGTGDRTIAFDYRNQSGTDKLEVLLSTDGGVNFTSLGAALATATTWTNKTFTTSSTASAAIVRFLATSDFGNDDIFIDNLTITAATLANSEVVKESVKVYPNPFKDVLNISDVQNVKSISVNDMTGRTIKNLVPSSQLHLSTLKEGVYVVNLTMKDGSVKAIKVIKK